MGWTVGPQTREELIAELLGPRHHESVAHRLIDNRLWCVKRYLRDGQERRYICLFLIEQFGAFDHGYKDMDESVHPYFYDCPLEFLHKVESYEAPGSAAEWRDCVRAFHEGGTELAARVRAAHARQVSRG